MSSVDRVKSGYRARWRTPDGRSRSKTFAKKIDAERHLTSVDHSKLSGAYVDPAAGRVTFKTYQDGWRERQVHRPSTVDQIESNLRIHVDPVLGERPIGSIRPSEVQSLVKGMVAGIDGRRPLAPATVCTIYTWVATIMRAAVVDRVIAQSPCVQIRLPVKNRQRLVPLKVEVVDSLIQTIAPLYSALIYLGASTGVRISEALGVTNDRIDWLRRELTVDRQLLRVSGNTPVFGPVKDRQNRPRIIPMPEVALTALAAHVRTYGLGPAGLLFTNGRGGPVHRSTFSDVWRSAAEPLGISLGDGYHQLRHFYASLLIRHGESVKTVQERLGHASAQITLDTYGHLWPDAEDRTRQAVDLVLGQSRAADEPISR